MEKPPITPPDPDIPGDEPEDVADGGVPAADPRPVNIERAVRYPRETR